MGRLGYIGWTFIPLAALAAIAGVLFQDPSGGIASSPVSIVAGGVFMACLGAAGLLLTLDSVHRGTISEECQEIHRDTRPVEFWWKIGLGLAFWAALIVGGVVYATKVWIK